MGTRTLPGELGERYLDAECIGQGAFGEVLRARDDRMSRLVALKLLLPGVLEEPRIRERFLREARLTARIRDPHVVRVYDHGFAGEVPFIVYEFIDGVNLNSCLLRRGRPYDLPESVDAFRQILLGLAALHDAGILHRDLKPANVLVRPTGDLVIADLGVAHHPEGETLTRTGEAVGTPIFMPPDQMRGNSPSPTWDCYAAALILVELLTGEIPMLAVGNLAQVAMLREQGPTDPLLASVPSAPAGLEELLRRVLDPDPDRRPQTAGEVLEELDVVERNHPRTIAKVSIVPPPPPAPAERKPPARQAGRAGSPMVPLAAILTLALLVVLGWGGIVPPSPPARSALTLALVRADELVRDSSGIRRALKLHGATSPEKSRGIWREAGKEFSRYLAPVVRALEEVGDPGAHLEPAVFEPLGRLQTIRRLLREESYPGAPGLLPGDDSGVLDKLYRRGVRILREARLDGHPRRTPGWRETFLTGLGAPGQRWQVVRAYPDMEIVYQGKTMHRDRILRTSYFGRPYADPAGTLSEDNPLVEVGRGALRLSAGAEIAVPEASFSLHPFSGDLILAGSASRWDHSVSGRLVVEGRAGGAHSFDLGPEFQEVVLVGRERPRWVGFRLRVDRRLLPPEPMGVRLRMIGIQPIGVAANQVFLTEVYQLVAGPPPPFPTVP